MRTCPFCAEEIQDAAVVCKHCGRDVPSIGESGSQRAGPQAGGPAGKRPRTTLYVLLGIMVVVLGVYVVSARGSAASSPQSAFLAPRTRPMQTITIVDEPSLDIGAGHYLSWPWKADRYRSCHVTGRVLGLAGGEKDVEVLLFDEDGYVNWKNHHDSKVYFQSSRQTATTLDANVPGTGKYVFVISNAYSLFTDKTVQAQDVRATCTD